MVMYAKIRRMFFREHLAIGEIHRWTGTEPKYLRASRAVGPAGGVWVNAVVGPASRVRRPMRDRRTARMLFWCD